MTEVDGDEVGDAAAEDGVTPFSPVGGWLLSALAVGSVYWCQTVPVRKPAPNTRCVCSRRAIGVDAEEDARQCLCPTYLFNYV